MENLINNPFFFQVMLDYTQAIPDTDMVTVPTRMVQEPATAPTPMVPELGTTVYPGYPSPLPQQPPLRLPPQQSRPPLLLPKKSLLKLIQPRNLRTPWTPRAPRTPEKNEKIFCLRKIFMIRDLSNWTQIWILDSTRCPSELKPNTVQIFTVYFFLLLTMIFELLLSFVIVLFIPSSFWIAAVQAVLYITSMTDWH